MLSHAVESIEVNVSADRLFGFTADPRNLPRWTNAFATVDGDRAVMRTPAGSVPIQLEVVKSKGSGSIDWIMKFPDGSRATAYSRVVASGPAASIYTFVLTAPAVPLEQLEGTLSQQREILREELARLRGILENE